jgi:hypothetical protein
MPSVNASQIIEFLQTNGALTAMLESYESAAAAPVWRSLVGESNILDPGNEGLDIPYVGHKAAVFGGMEGPVEHEPGQALEMTTLERAYQYQMKIFRVRRGISVPHNAMASARGRQVFGNQFSTFAARQGTYSALYKERYIAGMFQKGTLTAGSTQYFRNSYHGQAATDGLIYDGLPWFDGAHPLGARLGSSTTKSNIDTAGALTTSGLGSALDAMMLTNAVDDREDEIVIAPNVLLTPMGAQHRKAKKILESELDPDSANNAINPFQGGLSPLGWRFLSDSASASAFWLTTLGDCGLTVVDSGQPELMVWYDEDTECYKAGVGFYWGAAVNDWRKAYCAGKADS